MNEGFARDPGKERFPFGKNKRLPQSSHAAVSVDERVDEFQLEMEDAAFYEGVNV